jgi:uncharacterized membrane-anchored protein
MLFNRLVFLVACVAAGLLFVDLSVKASNSASAQSRADRSAQTFAQSVDREGVSAGPTPLTADEKAALSAGELASTDFIGLLSAATTARQQGDYRHALALDQRVIGLCVDGGHLSDSCASDAKLDSGLLRQAFKELTETLIMLGRFPDADVFPTELPDIIHPVS